MKIRFDKEEFKNSVNFYFNPQENCGRWFRDLDNIAEFIIVGIIAIFIWFFLLALSPIMFLISIGTSLKLDN